MASQTKLKHKCQWITITGPISAKPVKRIPDDSYNIVIMGMTGAGKSNFIETISSNGASLRISGITLDSVTKNLAVYRLDNIHVLSGYPVHIIDTPGFADPDLSEMTVITELQEWMRANRIEVINHILFLDRITDTRAPGSKRKVFDIFKAITGGKSAENMTILTTRWDEVLTSQNSEERLKQAETRFQDFKEKNNLWKIFVDNGARMMKFYNTQQSAIEALDQCLMHSIRDHFKFTEAARDSKVVDPDIMRSLRTIQEGRVSECLENYKMKIDELEYFKTRKIHKIDEKERKMEERLREKKEGTRKTLMERLKGTWERIVERLTKKSIIQVVLMQKLEEENKLIIFLRELEICEAATPTPDRRTLVSVAIRNKIKTEKVYKDAARRLDKLESPGNQR